MLFGVYPSAAVSSLRERTLTFAQTRTPSATDIASDQAKTDAVKKKTKLVNEKTKSTLGKSQKTAPTVSTEASSSSGQSIISKVSVVITNESPKLDREEDERLHKAKSPK